MNYSCWIVSVGSLLVLLHNALLTHGFPTNPPVYTTSTVQGMIHPMLWHSVHIAAPYRPHTLHMARISDKRRKQLGIPDDADDYDLEQALGLNTNDLITKIIAGSLILVIMALLGFVVLQMTEDVGESVCKPLLSGGRC